jgi:hypothetical protein
MFVGSNFGFVNDGDSVTVTVSGYTINQNDIILAFCDMGGDAENTTCTFPSGFNAIPGLGALQTNSTNLQIAAKVATASEPESYTFAMSTSDFHTIQIRAYSGRNTASIFSAVSQSGQSEAEAATPISGSFPGLTAVAGDDVVLFIGGDNQSSDGAHGPFGLTGPTSFSNQLAVNGSANFSPVILSADFTNNPGGATGTLSPTITATTASSFSLSSMAVSLAAASVSCTNSGYTSGGAITTPNGTSGNYVGNAGTFVTPNCSSTEYWQPGLGRFGTGALLPMAPLSWIIARRNRMKGRK